MDYEKLIITNELKGIAALRLFEIGKFELSDQYFRHLCNFGIKRAAKRQKFEIISNILRYINSSIDSNSPNAKILRQSVSLEFITDIIKQEAAQSNYKLIRLLAECLICIPSSSAVKEIIQQWHLTKRDFHVNSHEEKKKDKEKETCWEPMLEAIGACAASDSTYRNFDADNMNETKLLSLSKKAFNLYETRKSLLESYVKFVRVFDLQEKKEGAMPQFVSFEGVNVSYYTVVQLAEQIKSIDLDISQINTQIDNYEKSLSAGNILMSISANSQRYESYLRQYATLGLMHLLKNSYLNEDSRTKIKDHLNNLFQGSVDDKKFRTFEIRIDADYSKEAFVKLIHTGIWFLTQNPVDQSYDKVSQIFDDLEKEIPEIFNFFSKYPLRLVLPEDKYKFYGVYTLVRYVLERWTRYIGEKNIGEVISRYFELDDLTVPNSMGISVYTFQNPFIALPTLWHEYQHYGEEGVKKGNENEMSVYTLESIFLRHLILEHLKKIDQKQILSELQNILENLMINDLGGFLLLSLNFHDISTYSTLKKIIEINYPNKELSKDQAQIMAQQEIKKQDSHTIVLNLFNYSWCPEIKWPLLEESNSPIYYKLKSLLIKTFTQKNTLNMDEWLEIISEPDNARIIKEWELLFRSINTIRFRDEILQSESLGDIHTWINRI